MKKYRKRKKTITLADSRKISKMLLDNLRDFFPIEHEITIELIFHFLDDRLSIPFDIELMENELVNATTREDIQIKIRNYFEAIRIYFTKFRKEADRVTIHTYRRKPDEIQTIPLHPDVIRETEDHLRVVLEKWDEFEQVRRRLKSITGIWNDDVSFREYLGDILHTK